MVTQGIHWVDRGLRNKLFVSCKKLSEVKFLVRAFIELTEVYETNFESCKKLLGPTQCMLVMSNDVSLGVCDLYQYVGNYRNLIT